MKKFVRTALFGSAVALLTISAFAWTIPEGVSQFGSELNSQLIKRNPTDNYVFSPYSISQALVSVYAGALGETAEAMKESLHYLDNDDSFHRNYGEMSSTLMATNAPSEKLTLRVSNSLWLKLGNTITDLFTRRLTFYNMNTQFADFAHDPSGAEAMINKAVSEQTDGMINNLVSNLPKNTAFVITNAVVFRGTWKLAFEKELREGVFTLLDGQEVVTNFMTKTEMVPYGNDDTKSFVVVPYEGSSLAALIVIPHEGMMEQFESTLSASVITEMMHAESAKVDITIPKFTIETTVPSMKSVLSSLGNLGIMFDENLVDLSGINGIKKGFGKLAISDVVHKAVIEVSQTGTKASAATAVVGVHITSVRPDNRKLFVADRPFYFFIVDTATHLTMFTARMMNPTL